LHKVNVIKNQESCGSCWAFSATAAVESAWAIKSGSLISFSEQLLVDCETQDDGCNGGWPANCYTFLQSHFEVQEIQYPYRGRETTCQYETMPHTAVQTTGFKSV
jgi:C1A family cysteine protease